jgi:predicted small lipoprotein YifL
MAYRYLRTRCLIAALLLVLAGCGQTGPLYLPDQPPPDQQDPAQPH